MKRSADISDDGLHRRSLTIPLPRAGLAPMRESILWIMLNPSTADADRDDNTSRKVIKYSTAWGFGTLRICNLFTFIATDPDDLIRVAGEKPLINLRDSALLAFAQKADDTIVAWGALHKDLEPRAKQVLEMLLANGIPLWCLGITKNGQPRHPLYLRDDVKPFQFEVQP